MTWLIVLIIAALLVAGAFAFERTQATDVDDSSRRFIPDFHNDKIIMVKGWRDEEIKKIIKDFMKIYEKDGYPPYTIEPQKTRQDLYKLKFPQDIHPLLFTFLINYFAYPFDLELENRSIFVAGKTTLTAGFDGLDSTYLGQKAILYIPENDVDHDVVYMQIHSGANYANSFTEGVWRIVRNARLSDKIKKLIDGA